MVASTEGWRSHDLRPFPPTGKSLLEVQPASPHPPESGSYITVTKGAHPSPRHLTIKRCASCPRAPPQQHTRQWRCCTKWSQLARWAGTRQLHDGYMTWTETGRRSAPPRARALARSASYSSATRA
eukprot:TRINITY_DN8651_c0_g1_i2.p1 TRINITY_DN8651_c0_g1~~TRINITY_DN8651_c0_g1_i2.p1  ORF type:complete len:126 (+),score=4.50 TRINITY_DN8651_c0_g1_i2:542-919(+)